MTHRFPGRLTGVVTMATRVVLGVKAQPPLVTRAGPTVAAKVGRGTGRVLMGWVEGGLQPKLGGDG